MNFFSKKREIIISTVLAILFFNISLFTLSDYGINWDEPSHYIRGQSYLRFFLTGKDNYNGLLRLEISYARVFGRTLPSGIVFGNEKSHERSIYQYDGKKTQNYQWYLQNDFGHPPLNGILASLSNYIFYQKLGWLGDIQAYHLFIITVTSLVVFAVFLFTSSSYGIFAGLIAVLSVILYPLLFSESHFNIKDPVEMGFYTFSIITFYLGITKGSWKWIILTGIFAGLALGTKLNIAFAIFTIIPWIIYYKWKDISHFIWPFSKRITISILSVPIIAFAILFGTWPFLWIDPLNHFLSFISYYKALGTTSYQFGSDVILFGINTYAIQWVAYTTPLIILFLSLLGILYVFTKGVKEKEKTSVLVLLWFLTPIIRVTLPNAGIYGGVRQIMEYIPAMAILSGIGAKYIVELLNGYIVKRFKQFNNTTVQQLIYIGIILLFIPITLKLISIHPNENVYFNPLIGGLKGASEKNFPDWGTTIGSAYKGGIDWINQHVQKNGRVALVSGFVSNVPRISIRRDIYFSELHYSGEKKSGEYLMEVVGYQWDKNVLQEKRDYLNTLVPVYEEKVDGVAILKIWKNDIQHSKK